MADQPHLQDPAAERPVGPDTPIDAGSQALSEALRSSFGIVKIVMGFLALVFVFSGVFIVKEQERAIKLRFGRVVGAGEKALLGPGLHWSMPYPIESYETVSVTGIKKVSSTVGWYATTPEQELAGTEPMAGPTINPAVDGYALTADNNIIHARATVTYHVADPVQYVFNFVNASNLIQGALDNAVLYAASRFTVDDILTRDVAGFREAVRKRVTDLVTKQELGIVVEDCLVQSRPPRQLKDAFENVLKAEVTRNKVLQEARGYENQVTNRAGADALSRLNAAESDRVRLVNDVSSQAQRFSELLPQYQRNPQLFTQQRLSETLGRVLTNVQDKLFIAEGAPGKPRDLWLNLTPAPKQKADEQPKP